MKPQSTKSALQKRENLLGFQNLTNKLNILLVVLFLLMSPISFGEPPKRATFSSTPATSPNVVTIVSFNHPQNGPSYFPVPVVESGAIASVKLQVKGTDAIATDIKNAIDQGTTTQFNNLPPSVRTDILNGQNGVIFEDGKIQYKDGLLSYDTSGRKTIDISSPSGTVPESPVSTTQVTPTQNGLKIPTSLLKDSHNRDLDGQALVTRLAEIASNPPKINYDGNLFVYQDKVYVNGALKGAISTDYTKSLTPEILKQIKDFDGGAFTLLTPLGTSGATKVRFEGNTLKGIKENLDGSTEIVDLRKTFTVGQGDKKQEIIIDITNKKVNIGSKETNLPPDIDTSRIEEALKRGSGTVSIDQVDGGLSITKKDTTTTTITQLFNDKKEIKEKTFTQQGTGNSLKSTETQKYIDGTEVKIDHGNKPIAPDMTPDPNAKVTVQTLSGTIELTGSQFDSMAGNKNVLTSQTKFNSYLRVLASQKITKITDSTNLPKPVSVQVGNLNLLTIQTSEPDPKTPSNSLLKRIDVLNQKGELSQTIKSTSGSFKKVDPLKFNEKGEIENANFNDPTGKADILCGKVFCGNVELTNVQGNPETTNVRYVDASNNLITNSKQYGSYGINIKKGSSDITLQSSPCPVVGNNCVKNGDKLIEFGFFSNTVYKKEGAKWVKDEETPILNGFSLDYLEIKEDERRAKHDEDKNNEFSQGLKGSTTAEALRTFIGNFKGGLDAFSGFQGYSSLFAGEDWITNYKNTIDESFAKYLGLEYWSSEICIEYANMEFPIGDNFAFADTPSGLAQLAAFVEGTRTEGALNENGKFEYIYRFEISIRNGDYAKDPNAIDPMEFRVELRGDKRVDLFKGKQSVKRGDRFKKVGAQSIVKESTSYYNQVCLIFDQVPYKWRISNNELCSYIMANSGAATGFASSSGSSSGGSSGASSGETNEI